MASPPDEFAPDEAGLILLGDTQRAARWVPFARQQIREGLAAWGPVFSKVFRPQVGVEILIRSDFEIHKIIINAAGAGLWYEFFTSDPIYEPELATEDFIGEALTDRRVAGDSFLANLGSGSYSHVDFIDDNQSKPWQHFVTTPSAWSNQKRIGSIGFTDNHKRILASNHSNLKHMKFLHCRLEEGFDGLLTTRTKITDIGFNVPTSVWDESGSTLEVARSVPNAEVNAVDPFATEFKVDPSDGRMVISRPTTPYHSTSAIQTVVLSGGPDGDYEKDFFLYTDIYAGTLKIYEVADDWPTDGSFPASNPNPLLVVPIPTPLGVEHESENDSFPYSGVQWSFNSTGTKMVAVLDKRAPEVLPTRFATSGQPMARNNDVDQFTGLVISTIRHENLRPLAANWDDFYFNSIDQSWQLYFYTPVIVEIDINIIDDFAGFVTAELTVSQSFDGGELDRYFVAADYDISSDELVVAEIECYAYNGNLYHFTHPEDPDGPHEAEDIESAVHCPLKMTRWRLPIGDEEPESTGYVEVERARVTLWESDINHLYRNDLNTTYLDYDSQPYKAVNEAFATPYTNLYGHGSGSTGFPSSLEDDSKLNILQHNWKFNVGGMDLRLGAYWGQHEKITWETRISQVLGGARVLDRRISQSFLEYGVDARAPKRVYVPTPEDEEYTDWEQPEPSTQPPEGFERVSPVNHISQSVMTYCLKGMWYGEWAVHPLGRSYALSTPPIYCLNYSMDQSSELDEGSVFYPLQIDVIYDGKAGKTKTHQSIYNKVAAKNLSKPPEEQNHLQLRDYNYYGTVFIAPADMTHLQSLFGTKLTLHNNFYVALEYEAGGFDEMAGEYVPGNSFGTFQTSGVFFTKPVLNGGDPFDEQPEEEM